jgi:hypothetical protein
MEPDSGPGQISRQRALVAISFSPLFTKEKSKVAKERQKRNETDANWAAAQVKQRELL